MSTQTITTILNALLSIAFLVISLRAFFLYMSARSTRLFILGLAMGMIALTAAADTFSSSNISPVQLNTDWFLFIGQAVSFLFFFLSLVLNASNHLRMLMRWHILVSLFLLLLLILSPILPDFPQLLVRIALSGSRCILCFVIFFYYVRVFTSKETRFAFLMMASFMLLAFGYLVLILT
ncbi:MAG: hypothetical protein JOZ18_19765, partial [Chloroflexi bacterium]|nr:hypothetical protein [Chloroflexota bacterium]